MDLRSIKDSYSYIRHHKGASKTRVVKSRVGKFLCRQGTNDFQFANYAYEWGVKSYFLENYKNYDVFFDIGAGIGDYSILMANKGLEVYSYEPVNSNYKMLQMNVALNKLDKRIHHYDYGLGNDNYETSFYISPVNKGASHKDSVETNEPLRKGGSYEKVFIQRLDDFYLAYEIPQEAKILIKMDIEGMEVEALEGMAEFIRHYPNLSFVLEDKHTGSSNITRMLQAIDTFEIGQLDAHNIYAHKINV
jgi:FkbM family methyltransferase